MSRRVPPCPAVSRRALVLLTSTALLAASGIALAQRGPEKIRLPDGFQPEGIDSGSRDSFYVGSIPTGRVYRGSYRGRPGRVVVPAREGRQAIGLKYARGLLFVAGGATGDAYVYDASRGTSVRRYELAPDGQQTFVNDVTLTPRASYFTDSRRPVIYRVARNRVGRPGSAREIPLSGVTFDSGFNFNGVAAAEGGRVLLAVQSAAGRLWRVPFRAGDLYAVNARFGTEGPNVRYDVVRVER